MNKWLIPAMAAVAIIVAGCGGSGTSSSLTTTTGGIVSTDSIASVNLPSTPGQISVTYLGGTSRSPGDVVANISRVFMTAANGNQAETSLQPSVNVLTSAYSHNTVSLEGPVTPAQNSETYNTFNLNIGTIQIVQSDNTLGPASTGANGGFAVDQDFPSNITVMPGRATAIDILIDNNVLSATQDPVTNAVTVNFDRNLFLNNNTLPTDPFIESHFSDYVGFDISALGANAPTLNAGGVANKFYVSGDSFALGTGTAAAGTFEVEVPGGIAAEGTYAGPTVLTPNYSTYSLLQPNPTVIGTTASITAELGTLHPASSVFANLGSFEVLFFPSSKDNNLQQVVAVVESNAGVATNLYYGTADLTAKTIKLYPATDLPSNSTAGEVDGTITSELDTTGAAAASAQAVRSGRYSFASPPAGFRATGRFVDYRL